MTYQPSDYGTERGTRLIAHVRKHLAPAEISDLISVRTLPEEHYVYAAYVHHRPALGSGSLLREAIDAYLDPGPGPHGSSAYGEDLKAARLAANQEAS